MHSKRMCIYGLTKLHFGKFYYQLNSKNTNFSEIATIFQMKSFQNICFNHFNWSWLFNDAETLEAIDNEDKSILLVFISDSLLFW